MAILLSLPVLILALMVQLSIVSNLPLLGGTADLVMVILIAWALQENVKSAWVWAIVGGVLTSALSALPNFTPLICCLLIVGLIRLLRRRVWQIPILVMFIGIVLGTTLQHLVSLTVLFISGTNLPLTESLSWVTLPSILLNLLIALPVYAIMTDLAKVVYPVEVNA